MDLRREVAQVACRLGFPPRLDFPDGPISDFKSPSETRSSQKPKQKQNRRDSQKKGSTPTRNRSKRAGTKTDRYDKKALLETLSGPEEKSAIQLKKLRKARSNLPKSISPVWHVALDELPPLTEQTAVHATNLTAQEISKRRKEAADLCQNEKDAFEYRMHSSRKQGKWLLQVREQGTHVDRIAAFSILIRDSPIANISELDYLLNLAEKQKGSRDLVIHALKALAELFRCFLLPDRKLVFFEDRPLHLLSDGEESRLYLMLWFSEDCLKRKFARLVSCLESASLAPLEHLRSEAVTLVSDLLYSKPEQEAQLLSILIHKFGEKSKQLASKVAFLISKLITKHPRMKHIVLKEAEKFVFLSGTTIRSVQRVLQTFNLIEYEHNDIDRETATAFIDMCFTLFQQMVDGSVGSMVDNKRKAEGKSLTIVNRKRKKERRRQKQKTGGMEIDSTVLSSLISGIRRSLPFADATRLGDMLEKHVQALFKMVHVAPFGVATQVLALLTQILPSKANSLDRLYRAMYEKILDPHLAESKRLPLFISTLFKAIKDDPNLTRATAFVKRLLQMTSNAEPHLHCAFLLVVSELLKFKPGLKSGIVQPEERMPSSEESSAMPSQLLSQGRDQEAYLYKIDHREPIHCGADHTCLWELCSSLHYYHPVAQFMGRSLLSSQPAVSHGDPLQELTLFAFLERFANRKDFRMKTSVDGKIPTTPGTSLRASYLGRDTFEALASQDIPVEDAFFHKYFNLNSVKKAREARQTTKSLKQSKQTKKKEIKAASEERSFLQEDDDLESLESLELEGDGIDGEDIAEMFSKRPATEEKPPNELFDYSDLLQDVKEAYEESPENAEEDDLESEGLGEMSEDGGDTEGIDLPTEEFPELSSDSSDMDSEEMPPGKRLRKPQPESNAELAPAADYASLLGSD